ncbi:hypothetical protein [Catenuloplanes indicus]|uniref:Uncharacterized protein n=1 Tax=Catenuloplanes indicus TaxID=137267 RepID=A0AAE3VUR4_9ACTN|nr:hypothetical protein [Catenuloplanes indicus]MDQ0363987.1 hypothetical protein [Catenuloplanes indicus]
MTGTPHVTDLVRSHMRHYLRAPFLAEDARRRYAMTITRAGRVVVEGGMTSATDWQLYDWLTREPVAQGHDGPAGMASALRTMYHADNLYTDVPIPEPPVPSIPRSLQRALEEWICNPLTADEDIAAVVDWPVATVREHR